MGERIMDTGVESVIWDVQGIVFTIAIIVIVAVIVHNTYRGKNK
jgi:hypothetical protein